MLDSPTYTAANPDRILVVDDLADNSLLLQTVLEGEGYHVEVADRDRAALSKIGHWQIICVGNEQLQQTAF